MRGMGLSPSKAALVMAVIFLVIIMVVVELTGP